MKLCSATAEHCICHLPDGHGSPHWCKCGGAWTGDIDGDDFEMHSIPGSNPDFLSEVIDPQGDKIEPNNAVSWGDPPITGITVRKGQFVKWLVVLDSGGSCWASAEELRIINSTPCKPAIPNEGMDNQ